MEATLRAIDISSIEHEPSYYVASSRRPHFHLPSCKWADFFLNSPNLREFSSHEEAVDAGLKPCKTCCA